MFRLLYPASMVICNDIMAYFFGFFFGKTPLIKVRKCEQDIVDTPFTLYNSVHLPVHLSSVRIQIVLYVEHLLTKNVEAELRATLSNETIRDLSLNSSSSLFTIC